MHQWGTEDGGTAVEPLTRQSSLGYQVNHLARLLEHALRVRIDGHGVVPGQFAQLLALYEEEPLTQRDLCERVGIEQPTMANTLQRMQRDGLIDRVADPEDGRRAHVTLTPRAHRLRDALMAAARDVNAVAARGLTEAELATFMSALQLMIDNLEDRRRR
jgi:DNA-binding MarR family transcriptional regulator